MKLLKSFFSRSLAISLLLFPILVTYTTPIQAQSSATLKVQGTSLVNSSGNRFIVEGMNLEFYRDSGCSFVTTGQWPVRSQIVAKMKSMGINAVRFNYKASWLSQSSTNLTQFLDFMQLFAQNGIYVMPSDHSYTGKDLIGYSSTSFPMFKSITDGVRSRGFEQYLIWNPYNEPYGTTPNNNITHWVQTNKDTVNYLRNTLGFKGVIVLDTRSWASSFEPSGLTELKNHDATLLGGTPNMVFSNHWYPNHDYTTRVKPTFDSAGTLPLVIGELGQINPGTTPVVAQYPKDILTNVVNYAIPKGHNGVFAWQWNWCDENSMTNNDYVTLNTYGNVYPTYYYSKINGGTAPLPSGTATPIPTATPIATVRPTATPVPSSTVSPTSNPTTPPTGSDFLTAVGKDLKYRGQTIVLKGINFDNIGALGATAGIGGDKIGSGNIDHINHGELDYARLRQEGGNIARFGLSFNWYRENKTKYFQVIDQHIAWARKHNVWILFNMFTTPADCYEGYNQTCTIWSDSSQQTALTNFWVDMANRYKNEPAVAGYDIYNEPLPWSAGNEGWRTYYAWAQKTRDAISAVDSNHLVFIESEDSGQFRQKFTGNNIVYEVHFYVPMGLTHEDTVSTKLYPGYFTDWFEGVKQTIYIDKNALSGANNSPIDLHTAIPYNWGAQNNVPIFVGEWGSRATSPNYEQYVADVADIFQQWKINHTYYTWRHDPNFWKWGIFQGPKDTFTITFPEKLAAVKRSWQGTIFPDFSGSSPTTQPSTSPGTESECSRCDINEDDFVDIFDYSILSANFFKTNPSTPRADINRDGMVDVSDYAIMQRNFLKTCTGGIPTTAPNTTATPQPTAAGTYPREIQGSNSKIKFIEVKPRSGNTVYLQVQVDPSVTTKYVDWYINSSWTNQDEVSPWFLGGDTNGNSNGFTLQMRVNKIRAVVYYDLNQHFIESTIDYNY